MDDAVLAEGGHVGAHGGVNLSIRHRDLHRSITTWARDLRNQIRIQ
ncbi:MAG: hypothetical protein V5A27_04270 [Halapricum sp.]